MKDENKGELEEPQKEFEMTNLKILKMYGNEVLCQKKKLKNPKVLV
jgi:hypothetical protein